MVYFLQETYFIFKTASWWVRIRNPKKSALFFDFVQTWIVFGCKFETVYSEISRSDMLYLGYLNTYIVSISFTCKIGKSERGETPYIKYDSK